MNEDAGHLEQQYWGGVIADRPDEQVERQRQQSCEVRAARSAHLDISYGEDERQSIDLFIPHGDGPWPLLVFIHGGYWQLGGKEEWAFLAPCWNRRQVAVANVGYRLVTQTSLAGVIADACNALQFVAEEADRWNIDARRIVVSGISAGAHLAAMVVATSSAAMPKAAVLLSGVYDLRPLKNTTPGVALADACTAPLAEVSPLGHEPQTAGKNLIAYGADETAAFHSQSRLLASYFGNFGIDVDIHCLPGTNHYSIAEVLHATHQGPVNRFISKALGIDMHDSQER